MNAAGALARREIVRFFRQPSRVVGAVLPPIMAWVLIGSGFGSSFRAPGAAAASSSYFAYFFPGTVVLVVLFASIFSTISVIEDRREGFLQAVLVSPARPSEIVLGKVAGGTVLGFLQGGVLLLLVPVLGLPWRSSAFLGAIGIVLVVSFALTGLGFTIAWSLESTQGFHAIMNLFLIPMWLLSGAFFPMAGAPRWLQVAMAINPLTYGVAALRHGLAPGSEGLPSTELTLAVTFGFALLTFASSLLVVSRNPTGPARRALKKKKGPAS
ncbi:MAG: ABC transporter permease [Thermoanaerobaculia bacterium]